MVIAEKAAGPVARTIVSISICVTLFGFGCVVIILCASFFQNIFETYNVNLSSCIWMVIVTAGFIPLCLLGTPKEFWCDKTFMDMQQAIHNFWLIFSSTDPGGCLNQKLLRQK